MLQDTLTLYKLIVLYMTDRVDFPLTTAQVSNFLLEREYTNFLTLQQTIGELTDAGMLDPRADHNRTRLVITPEGRDTLHYFENRISEAIRQDIDAYLKENDYALRDETSITGDYYKATSGEYEARLVAKERGVPLIDLTLSVPTAEAAAAICDNWQQKNQEIYQYLTKELF
ncbi:MAG: DUF4364 family protein [Candidatus Gastranaerophilales bacterium]|nr:DUF4364 family protein [Candidatus Gastranaerophilales bacterium]